MGSRVSGICDGVLTCGRTFTCACGVSGGTTMSVTSAGSAGDLSGEKSTVCFSGSLVLLFETALGPESTGAQAGGFKKALGAG